MYEGFFNLSVDMLCVAGYDGFFKHLNPAWTQTLGFTDAELMARPFLDFVHPDDRVATIAVVEDLARGATIIHFRNRYECRDGTYRWLDWTAIPAVSAGLIYAVGRDVTQEVRAEAVLKDANDRLVRANVELQLAHETGKRFLANMSHELRTPLNAILGFSQLLIDDLSGRIDAKTRLRFLNQVNSSGRHLLGLINDILDLSKVEAGQMELNLTQTAVAATIDVVVTTVEPLAASTLRSATSSGTTWESPTTGTSTRQTPIRSARPSLYSLRRYRPSHKSVPSSFWTLESGSRTSRLLRIKRLTDL
jgi:PAS domain S-box-containing protein